MSSRTSPAPSKKRLRLTPTAVVRADRSLPIFAARAEVLQAVDEHDCVLIIGETGSGKSTQVVQFLLESGRVAAVDSKRCCITQPRRVAALTVCGRVAAEVGCAVGAAVGYAMRFERAAGRATAIKFATDGYVIREAMGDAELSAYGVVVIDEAHERSLHTDVLCGLVKRAMVARRSSGKKHLKVVVMSATLEVEAFRDFFSDESKVVRVPGRLYGVDVFYTVEGQEDYMEAAMLCCAQLHGDPTCVGDVLVFMPGQEEIASFVGMLRQCLTEDNKGAFVVVSLYASMSKEEQLLAFAPSKQPKERKFVIATTIAETSVTIAGVRHVVDPGLVKTRRFAATTGFEALEVVATSQAQARQRCGRAGREAPGRCYRLYPEAVWSSLPPQTSPEILRAELSSVVLQLKLLGIDNPETFDFVSKPPAMALLRALEVLYALEFLDSKGKLTDRGRRVAPLPLPPIYANLVLLARERDDLTAAKSSILSVVALLTASEQGVFLAPPSSARPERREAFKRARASFTDAAGDVLSELAAFEAFRALKKSGDAWCSAQFVSAASMKAAGRVRGQLMGVLKEEEEEQDDDEDLRVKRREATITALVAGLSCVHSARRDQQNRCYRTFRGNHEVYIHPSSLLHAANPAPKTFVFTASVHTNRQYVRGITVFDAKKYLPVLNSKLFIASSSSSSTSA